MTNLIIEHLPEDFQIDVIGKTAIQYGSLLFVVDTEGGKDARYIEKLKNKFPTLTITGHRINGPEPNTVTVEVKFP